MTHSRWNSLGRRGAQLAIVLVAASAAFAASPARISPPSASACPNLGQMTVTAPRLPRRAVLIAELGSMTVTAPRQEVVAHNAQPRATRAAF